MRPFAILLLACMLGTAQAEDLEPGIGDTISDLRFKDIRALERTLADLGKKRAYVFVFTTIECPLVGRTMPKLVELDRQYGPQEVQFVAVNVGLEDTIREMAAQAIELDAPFPFVKDLNGLCTKALGVERTPEVAVLDGEKKLVYRGRIDDQFRLGGARPEPTRRDLELALKEILDNRPVSVPETPVDGCRITLPEMNVAGDVVPTFHKDVLPILHRRCVNCHRPGTAAPFALLTYEDAMAHAEMLAEVVTDERMPPWYANRKHGTFQNDPSLSKSERDTLIRWVRSDRVEGDSKETPPAPTFPSSTWRIGEPDLIVTMVDQHSIPATGFLPYRYVVLPHVFLKDTWVEAVEIRPENPAVVHHCNMAYATPNGAGEETFITGYVPGGQPLDLGKFNAGVGYLLPRFSVLGLQIHYTTTGKAEKNRISIGLRFPRGTVQKQMRHFLLDPHNLNIAPGHGAFPISAHKTLKKDSTLLGLFTHMHVRGKDMTYFAEVPGQPRETLLQIPNFNFEWQLGYEIAAGTKRLPKGTKIEAIAHFDNSSFNPFNPDPTRTVPWGQQTYDEMFNGFVFFIEDDENLNLKIDSKTGQVVSSTK